MTRSFSSKDLKLTPYLGNLIEEVKKELEGNDDAKNRIKFSCRRRTEAANYGSSLTGNAHVVLPEYLDVRSMNDLNAQRVNAFLEETYEWRVPRRDMWFTDPGKLLIDSFILSEGAKKYIIAKEMACTMNNDVPLLTLLFMGSMTTFHLMVSAFEKRKKPMNDMFFSVLLSAFIALMFFKLMHTQRSVVREQSGNLYAVTKGRATLREASEASQGFRRLETVDPEYHRGGVEYYSKLIQRNLALRNLIRSLPYSMANPVINQDGSWKKHFWSVEISSPETLNQLHEWAEGKERSPRQKEMFQWTKK